MTVYLTFTDGSSQETYGVRTLEIEAGAVSLDGRRFPLSRIERLSTSRASQPEAERASSPPRNPAR